MLHIYWGLGKGKSSTLNGMALRAKGADLKVGIFRFLKGRTSSEDDVLRRAGFSVFNFSSNDKFVRDMSPEEAFKARSEALSGLQFISFNKNKYDLIIIDELLDLCAHNVNFITEDHLVQFLEVLKNKEVAISGHTHLNRVFDMADLITEYKPTKHYFEKGIKARKGIEF